MIGPVRKYERWRRIGLRTSEDSRVHYRVRLKVYNQVSGLGWELALMMKRQLEEDLGCWL